MKHPKLFLRQVEDSITRKYSMSVGFRTDSKTRPEIIAGLVTIMREHPELVDDVETLNEMLTFARNSKGRPEAMEGAHDDCVMALAIAYYIREQQSFQIEGEKKKRAKWREDQYEDYFHSGAQERAELIRLWGDPF